MKRKQATQERQVSTLCLLALIAQSDNEVLAEYRNKILNTLSGFHLKVARRLTSKNPKNDEAGKVARDIIEWSAANSRIRQRIKHLK